MIVKEAKNTSINKASTKFGVDRKRIREWIGQEKAGKFDAVSPVTYRLPGAGRHVTSEKIDNEIYEWFLSMRQKGLRVSGKRLRMEAQHRYIMNGITGFKASDGWLRKWKRRHSVSQRTKTTVAQHLPEDLSEKVLSFQKFIIRMRKIREYPLEAIGNMDETPVFFDMPGNNTLDISGTKSVLIKSTGHEKERITVALAAMANGKKLPPFVILKGVRPPKASDIPKDVKVFMTSNGWMNESAAESWIKTVWRKAYTGRKLLVWDAFRAHKTQIIKDLTSNKSVGDSDIAMIPGGCTSILQPADVSWNRPFKVYLQEKWDDWLLHGEHTFTPAGRMRKPTVKLMLAWISEAWKQLSEGIIIRSFRKTGISNMMDGTEDDLTWDEDEEDDDAELNMPGFSAETVEQATTVSTAVSDEVDKAIDRIQQNECEDVDSEDDSDEEESQYEDDYYYDSDDGNKTD